MSAQPAVIFASFTPRPGKQDEVLHLLEELADDVRTEPGNEVFSLFRAQGDTTSFHVFERYRDQEALDAHRASEHYKNYRATIPDLLAEPIGVLVLSEVDGDDA